MAQGLGMGGHCLPNEGLSKVWLTPPGIIQALGPFDLDPCAAPSPRPWPTATEHIELPEDGLSSTWEGRVWLNPPYTQNIDGWMEKMGQHRNGIALTFARTETELWHRHIWPVADSILFIQGRIWFYRPDGSKGNSNAGAPSVLISYSAKDTEALIESKIAGRLIKLDGEI